MTNQTLNICEGLEITDFLLLGSRFALMQIKAVVYYLVLNFAAEPNDDTQIPLKLKKHPFQLLFDKSIKLDLKLRQK